MYCEHKEHVITFIKIIKMETMAHYMIKWTDFYFYLIGNAIDLTNARKLSNILGLTSISIFIFFQSPHFEIHVSKM